jgi:uncharacterized protein
MLICCFLFLICLRLMSNFSLSGNYLRYPRLSAAAAVVLLLLMAWQIQLPVVETRIEDLDIDENPYKISGERMADLFGSKNLVQVSVKPATTDMALFAADIDSLKTILEYSFPGLRVETINRALPLIYRNTGPDVSVHLAFTTAMDIPIVRNLVSRDKTAVLLVAFADKAKDFDPLRFDSILSLHRPAIGSVNAMSSAHIEQQIEESIMDDYALMIPLFILFFTGLLYFSYRSFTAVLFCIFNLLLSFIPIFFFLTLTDVKINQVTMPAIPVVVILSLSASVHLLTGFSFRKSLVDKSAQIASAIQHYLVPTFLSTLTTSVSFCSFYLSDSLYIRQFGLVAGSSIMVVFIITFLLAPITLQMVKVGKENTQMGTITREIETFLFRYHKPISVALLFIAFTSVFFINRVSFRTNIETYIPRGTPVYESLKELKQSFHSLAALDVLVESSTQPDSTNRGSTRRELVRIVSQLTDRISEYPGVVSAESIKDQLDFENRFFIPGFRATLFPRSNNPYVSQDQLHYRINIRLSDPDDIPRIKTMLADDFEPFRPGFNYSIYSDYLYFQFISAGITNSLLRSLLVSALFIILIISFLTMSLTKTLLSVIVNCVPLAFMVLILVAFGVDMNITTSISLVICLGLIVDDTIQILYRRVRLREPLGELGFGILTTSMLVTGGFLTFLISNSRPSQIFGLICATVFIIAAVSDMTLLPWLLRDDKEKQ